MDFFISISPHIYIKINKTKSIESEMYHCNKVGISKKFKIMINYIKFE